jgi:DNA polymerase-3 subunit alpha
MTFFPLHVHSHDSLLDGLSKPKDIAKRCKELGLKGCALTDHGVLSGAVSFVEAMKSAGLKPILGCEFYICEGDPTDKENRTRSNTHLVVLAKNKQGWQDLIAATSQSNHPDYFYYAPRLDLATLKKFCTGNWIAFSGHMGSHLANEMFIDHKEAYSAQSYDEATRMVDKDWVNKVSAKAKELEDIFGKGNFFLEIQLIDVDNLPASGVVAKGLRYLSKKIDIPCVATPDAHYAYPEDADDQRVLLSNHPSIDTPLKDIYKKMVSGDDISLGAFFKSRNYYIPGHDEMMKLHTEEEVENADKIADMCEDYTITGKPMPPRFPLPEKVTAIERLRERCREGWQKRWPAIKSVIDSSDHTKEEYAERFEMEISVLENAKLADYFLIVDDIIHWARKDGQLTGAGRGSADGSLILYLLEVGHIDPIKHDLMFERFYNAGRNTADRVSLPDVDMDFEKLGRERIIGYINDRFGEDRVSQMITFSKMQGRSVLQDVMRAHSACSPEERNRITKNIPDEADISDQLEDMRQADKDSGGDGSASIIQWALENREEDLKQWCYIGENGNLQGPMSKIFEQSIRMEGTKRSRSKHAAGIVIANEPLAKICPMVHDKSTGESIAGMEMNDLESMGHIKFDILGIAILDKIHGVQDLLSSGEFGD